MQRSGEEKGVLREKVGHEFLSLADGAGLQTLDTRGETVGWAETIFSMTVNDWLGR